MEISTFGIAILTDKRLRKAKYSFSCSKKMNITKPSFFVFHRCKKHIRSKFIIFLLFFNKNILFYKKNTLPSQRLT